MKCTHRSRTFIVLICRIRIIVLSQVENAELKDFPCLEALDFLATFLVGAGGGNGKGATSTSDRSCIWMNWGTIAADTGIGDGGGAWAVTDEFIKSLGKGVSFSETTDVFTVDPISENLEKVSETDGAEGKLVFSAENGDWSTFTSVSERNH